MRDPYYATNAFYDALVKIDDYKTMRITEAAQKVQRSGFPEAYEDHAPDARALASVLTGYSPGGLFSCVVHEPTEHGQRATAVMRQVERAYGDLDIARTGSRQDVAVTRRRRRGRAAARLVGRAVRRRPRRPAAARGGRLRRQAAGAPAATSEDGWTAGGEADETTVRISMG